MLQVLFGLSMDDQAFLVSRMAEEWSRTRDNARAVLVGQTDTARVITAAAAIMIAAWLPKGRAVGADRWTRDQSGNSPEVTLANAAAAGVADRVEVHTADMTALPFPDRSFDVVTSALAIHNIPTPGGRYRALDEAMRVLRPGGQLQPGDAPPTRARVLVRRPVARHHAAACGQGSLV